MPPDIDEPTVCVPVSEITSKQEDVNLIVLQELKIKVAEKSSGYRDVGVTDLVKWLSDPIICRCKALLQPRR